MNIIISIIFQMKKEKKYKECLEIIKKNENATFQVKSGLTKDEINKIDNSVDVDKLMKNLYDIYLQFMNKIKNNDNKFDDILYGIIKDVYVNKIENFKLNGYSKIVDNIDLIEVSLEESIDIDNYQDWWVAEHLLKQKKIIIKTDATQEIGTGHIYRGLSIASKLINHEVLFLIDENKELGIDIIKHYNYPYITHSNKEDLLNKINNFKPDIVINDILNTDEDYIKALKNKNYFVINFEDIGNGAKYADLVFDALYEHKIPFKIKVQIFLK